MMDVSQLPLPPGSTGWPIVGEALASHRCGGVEYSTLVPLQFFTELLRAPAPGLPAQDLRLDMSRIPASWRSGLRVRLG